jgi:nickel-type superoxide dismutase maturation protease
MPDTTPLAWADTGRDGLHWPLLRVKVAERSMEPALRPGDWLLVRRTRRVRPGQIVLARHPGQPDMLIVKRAARRVGDGWWLDSDNQAAGAVDSRRFGAVPLSLIEGRLLARYWRPRAG